MSKNIRWSLDLRWQKPQDPLGFYGLKEGVMMRSSKDPDLTIDWESFNAVDRNQKQIECMTGKVGGYNMCFLSPKKCFI